MAVSCPRAHSRLYYILDYILIWLFLTRERTKDYTLDYLLVWLFLIREPTIDYTLAYVLIWLFLIREPSPLDKDLSYDSSSDGIKARAGVHPTPNPTANPKPLSLTGKVSNLSSYSSIILVHSIHAASTLHPRHQHRADKLGYRKTPSSGLNGELK